MPVLLFFLAPLGIGSPLLRIAETPALVNTKEPSPCVVPMLCWRMSLPTVLSAGRFTIFLRSIGVKERELFKRGGLKGEQLVVLEETRLVDIFRLFPPQRYHFIRVMDRSQHLHGEITEFSLIRAAIHDGLDIPIKKIL